MTVILWIRGPPYDEIGKENEYSFESANKFKTFRRIIMGVDLIRNNEEMGFNWSGWRKILEIAFNHGWEPTGTVNAINEAGQPIQDWSGNYFSNDFQCVTDEDAKNLAKALERALSEFDEEDYRKYIFPFIEFCKKGGFRIF